MDRRIALAVALLGLALALLLAVWMAPDTGEDPRPPVAAAPPAASGAAPAAVEAPPPAPARRDDPRLRHLPPPAPPPPRSEVTNARGVYVGTTEAVGRALVDRREALVRCWRGFVDRAGANDARVDTRFSVQLSVTPEEDGTGRVEAQVVNVPDDADLADCVDAALADARFAAPPRGAVSVVWPVPVSEAEPPP